MSTMPARKVALYVAALLTLAFAGWWSFRGDDAVVRSTDDVSLVQEAWGTPVGETAHGAHGVVPLCRAGVEERAPNGRSVVVVTVSTPGVARGAVAASGGEGGVVVVERVAPAGASSAQALGSIFGGAFPLGVDPGGFVLPPHVDGLPAALVGHGYRTIGAAGVELTFGNRRAALRGLGFEEFVEPRGDGEAFDVVAEVTGALAALRAESPEVPFFAWVHTPDPAPLRAWFREHEAARGTVLVLVALRSDGAASEWTTPLILEGEDLEAPEGVSGRLGSHTDVSATIRDLLGMAPGACEQGISLVAESWPDDRVVASFGAGGETLRVFEGDEEWTVPGEDVPDDVQRFAERFRRVAAWSAREGVLGLTKRRLPVRPAVEARPVPQVISHRGNVDGPRADGESNKPEDFDAALAAGFEWIELDVGITRDGELVVMHNQFVADWADLTWLSDMTLAELRAQPGHEEVATFDAMRAAYGARAGLMVDVKHSPTPSSNRALAEAVARRARTATGHRLYQSFSHEVAAYIAHACEPCEVGWLTPPEVAADGRAIEAARLHRFDFLSIRHDLVTAEFIAAAHGAGVRVYVYGLNDVSELARFGGTLPDGIITDHRRLLERVIQRDR